MFTRKGDQGETDNGTRGRVSKSSHAVAIEGMIDESTTILGLSVVKSKWADISEDLMRCQVSIFNMGEHIILSGKGRKLVQGDVNWLEDRTRAYKEELGKVKLFVLPGGSEQSAILHLARVTVRGLEREIVKMNEEASLDPVILQFSNRLSSLLFMMALVANKRLGIEERIWEIGRES